MNDAQGWLLSQLRRDVESICLPEGRVVGSPGHRRARPVLLPRPPRGQRRPIADA